MALPRKLGRLPHLRKVWVIREIFFRLLACRRHTTLRLSEESAYPAGSSITQPTLTASLNGEGNVAFRPLADAPAIDSRGSHWGESEHATLTASRQLMTQRRHLGAHGHAPSLTHKLAS